MSAVEQKMPGYFTSDITESSSEKEGFDTDHVPISEKDYSYALGTRREASIANPLWKSYFPLFSLLLCVAHIISPVF